MIMRKITIFTLLIFTTLGVVLLANIGNSASAASAVNFNAGRIIDDGVFTASGSMNTSQIQAFLNSKVPVCDTWHAPGYGQNPPFICLKDYVEGGRSAAQIIYDTAQQYQINPQVLIVLLQKEQGLVTDTWPLNSQYRTATGYGCPDTAPCDSQYYGLTNQLNWSGKMFRAILNNSPTWYTPYVLGNNYIRWNPQASCGGSTVNIENRSTQALYNYTPYRPNQAALNAGYGTGDGCSAYGNRNFYLYFTDWFGSTFGGDPVSTNLRLTSPIATSPANPIAGETVTVSYTVKNFGSTDISYQNTILQCRYNTTTNCDSPYAGASTIAAGASATITSTVTLTAGTNYTLTPFFLSGGVWYRYGVEASTQNSKVINVPNMAIISDIATSGQPTIGQPMAISYTVRNNSTLPIYFQDSVLQCRYEVSTNCDPAYTGPLTLNPTQTRTFTQTITPSADGTYVLTPYFLANNTWYTYSGSLKSRTINISDLRLTGEITASPAQPVPGQDVTVDYAVKNFGTKAVTYDTSLLQCRFNTLTNCDPAPGTSDALDPGESKVFSTIIPSIREGSYKFVPYFLYDNTWLEYNKGVASANNKTVSVPRYIADMRLVGDITATPADPIPGEQISISYRVRNFGTSPAIYQDSVLQCRYNANTNCDSSYTGKLTIESGAERTFTYTITDSAKSGTYDLSPYYMQNDSWYKYGNGTATANTKRVVVQTYEPDLRLTGDITTSPTQPTSGQTVTVGYTVRNFGTRTVIYDNSVLQCRRNTTVNCDPAWDTGDSLNPGESKVFSTVLSPVQAGSYRLLPYFSYNGRWYEFGKGTASSNVKLMSIQ